MQVGATETLLANPVRLAGGANVPVRLEIWSGMIYVWHLFYQRLESGRQALAAAGALIRARRRLSTGSRRRSREGQRRSYPLGVVPGDAGGAAAAVSTAGVAAFGIASVVIAVAPIAALVVAGRLTHPARHGLVAARWSPSMTTKRTQ
jgi:hypothetical protein